MVVSKATTAAVTKLLVEHGREPCIADFWVPKNETRISIDLRAFEARVFAAPEKEPLLDSYNRTKNKALVYTFVQRRFFTMVDLGKNGNRTLKLAAAFIFTAVRRVEVALACNKDDSKIHDW